MILATRDISIHLPESAGQFAHLNEYFGIWAMREATFKDMCTQISRMDLQAHLAHAADARANADSGGRGVYQVTPEGVALITVRGPMMKFASSFSGSGTVDTRRKVRAAADDPFVKAIVLVMDTPGGTVSGTKDLADDVRAAAKQKPLYTYIEDLCCSAGYWVGSQATKVFSNATSLSPCIGTYMAIDDWSKAYAEAGVRTYVIKAGEFKGAGLEGTEITPEQLAEWQSEVNDLNEHFVSSVAAGRKVAVKKAREWADGRAFVASRALEMGVLDGIQSLDETIAMAAKARPPRTSATGADLQPGTELVSEPGDTIVGLEGVAAAQEEHDKPNAGSASESEQSTASEGSEANSTLEDLDMTKENNASDAGTQIPKAATLEELEAACPGADNDFLMKQLRGKATVDSAQKAWMIEQNGRIQALNEKATKAEEAKQKAEQDAQVKRPGNRSLGAGITAKPGESDPDANGDSGDPIAVWNGMVDERVKKGMSKRDAIRDVRVNHPDVNQAYVEAYNEQNQELLAGPGRQDSRYKRRETASR